MPDRMYRFRDRLPAPGEAKAPQNELGVRVDNSGVGQVFLYDVIDSWGGAWGVSASEFAEALSALPSNVQTIQLHVNSPGGEVFEAIAIKNLLAQHSARVVAVVDGLAASAASFIAAAADEVVMGENAEMMIHDASGLAIGNAADFSEYAQRLDAVSDNIASIYAARGGRTAAEWREVMKAETWYAAQEAVDAGLADRVGTPDQGAESNASEARRQFAAALNVIRKAGTPAEPTERPTVPVNSTTEEKARQQTGTAPAATGESGAASRSTEPSNATTTSLEGDAMPGMTIEEREARITEIDARLKDIDAANSGDVLPTVDQQEWDGLSKERNEHSRAVAAQRQREKMLASLAANSAANEGEEQVAERASFAERAPAVIIKPENIYDTAAIRQKARAADDLGKAYRDHAMRAVEIAKFPGADREEAQTRVASLVDRFAEEKDSTLALRVLNTGSSLYDRAFGKAVKAMSTGGLNPQELQALTLGSDPDGGYAVPFQLDPTVILTSSGSENPLRQISRVVQITGKQWEGLTSAGITVTRKGEVAEATNDSPTFAQPTVDTSRADGFVPFSIALEASWTELRDELTMMLAEAKNDEEAASFLVGAGTAVTGGGTLPQGILTGLSAASSTYVVTAGTTGVALADLRKVKSSLPERFRGNTAWLAADTFYDAADSLITQVTAADVAAANDGVLLGRPKYQASSMPDYATTSNANLAVFGNFQRGFIIVDRIGMNVELIPQIFGPNGRPTAQRGIFAYWFNGSKVLVPNAFRLLRAK